MWKVEGSLIYSLDLATRAINAFFKKGLCRSHFLDFGDFYNSEI